MPPAAPLLPVALPRTRGGPHLDRQEAGAAAAGRGDFSRLWARRLPSCAVGTWMRPRTVWGGGSRPLQVERPARQEPELSGRSGGRPHLPWAAGHVDGPGD